MIVDAVLKEKVGTFKDKWRKVAILLPSSSFKFLYISLSRERDEDSIIVGDQRSKLQFKRAR